MSCCDVKKPNLNNTEIVFLEVVWCRIANLHSTMFSASEGRGRRILKPDGTTLIDSSRNGRTRLFVDLVAYFNDCLGC